MAFKLIVLAACLAYASAGYINGPAAIAAPAVAYSAAPAVSHVSYSSPLVQYGTPTLTSQSQNTYRSFGNLGQISTYSKTIDTPFSSVSKADVRVSNPGLKIAAAPALAYAAPAAYAAPVAHAAYAAPVAHAAYAAPVAHAAYAAPVAHAAYAAPVAHAAPAIGVAYSAAPAVAHVSYSNGYGINYGW